MRLASNQEEQWRKLRDSLKGASEKDKPAIRAAMTALEVQHPGVGKGGGILG